ncbi:MAG: hypothetical protein U9N62_00680 [Thermotogota bacterium]|nr:hypothetical protein [Thermotogota bacterium]
MEKIEYLIIGNGITGLSAAQEIRKQDGKGRILNISQEDMPTYYRVKLSHYISKSFERDSLLVHDWKWYEERQIELLLSNMVWKCPQPFFRSTIGGSFPQGRFQESFPILNPM